MNARVLAIGGSDSSGGAGVQADIKTIMALGGEALTATTALTTQDARRVHSVLPSPPDFVAAQVRLALSLGIGAVKIGMLAEGGIATAVADALKHAAAAPLVVDPVLAAGGGSPLLSVDGADALRRRIIPMATLLTPNAPEAAALTGLPVENLAGQRAAAAALRAMGAQAVLVKGGHISGESVRDLLLTDAGETGFDGPRLTVGEVHGTGCTLAAAIALGLARGNVLPEAIASARAFLRGAMARPIALGDGFVLDHGWMQRAEEAERRR